MYRLRRKGLFDSLAGLSSALVRMLDEPASKQRAVADIHLFIVQNYLIAAHVAALRILLRRHARALPKAQVDALLQRDFTQVGDGLADLRGRLKLMLPQLADDRQVPKAGPLPAAPPEAPVGVWSGWELLQRRLSLLLADADAIGVHGMAIGSVLSRPE